ncbi:carbonic anhydrase [Pseudenhygromyxa sp. WMMC2535]|uniref:carbonic anhydrase n=1 Tax=Pseudenhygromyxa sp. WMMC2535 TaxID=2712867 RepID=UPI0015560B2A|nr:carbonic anhydrase [Pseudenhygromyxa sp. WMMC2535]NVB38107.1 carbonic anhydrase [Pseudenhygromyxa sp. WMMC2535]
MSAFDEILENNRKWAAERTAADPEFFKTHAKGQRPSVLYIGCADSRVPACTMMGLDVGDVFVHRNVANLVPNADDNVTAVINYAVCHLEVEHVVVCGHYGCGGVEAAMGKDDLGVLNPWLRNIRDVYRLHQAQLDAIADEEARYRRLVELNVEEQCLNVLELPFVHQRYRKGGSPKVHGWVYDLGSGRLVDLKIDAGELLERVSGIYELHEAAG